MHAASQNYPALIEQLKNRIHAMLALRNGQSGNDNVIRPAPIWNELLEPFTYLMELSAESLRNIRFHTGLLNGGNNSYWQPYPPLDARSEARRLGYTRMIKDIPERYRMAEPPFPNIGVEYEGRTINSNVARYQNCASILYHAGAMNFIETSEKRQVVVEIGGGYGGLAHCLKMAWSDKVSYVIIDLPETLLFCGAFLLANNPGKSLWVYDEDEAAGAGLVEKILSNDFTLLPNFVAQRLEDFEEIALMLNLQSFQEMTGEQVVQYLEIARRKLSFCLYSDNMDCHPYNKDDISVSALLKERFTLFPDPEIYLTYYRGFDLKSYFCYQKFLAQPPGAARKLHSVPDHLFRPQGLRPFRLRHKIKSLEILMRRLCQ